jgi:hypothetical protein
MKSWIDHTQYRATCDDCGELHMVAVIQTRGRPRIRICRTCYPYRNWTKPQWDDARWQRHRAANLQRALGRALRERDDARQKIESAIDREVEMLSQPFFRPGYGPVGVVMDRAQSWDVSV